MQGNYDTDGIAEKAKAIRRNIIIMLQTNKGHLGGSMSIADIVASLYFGAMDCDPADPEKPDRDRFILSKGHAVLAQYAALAEHGLISRDLLPTLKQLGSPLQGHPDMRMCKGLEANTGSLGQGLSLANGMALAGRLDHLDYTVFVIIGDGELSEGQVWEAAAASSHYKLDNVIAFIDNNGLQATGKIKERFDTSPFAEKFRAFGWNTMEINGHSIPEILTSIDAAKAHKGEPTAIIAHTVKGKGMPFAEGQASFHHSAMTGDQYRRALEEVE